MCSGIVTPPLVLPPSLCDGVFFNNKQPIVMDVGSGWTRMGLAGQEAPSCVFPSVVGRVDMRTYDVVLGQVCRAPTDFYFFFFLLFFSGLIAFLGCRLNSTLVFFYLFSLVISCFILFF